MHGPFPNLKSSIVVQYIESDPARELFSFNDGESSGSRSFQQALYFILEAGVRFVGCGSWYDQG